MACFVLQGEIVRFAVCCERPFKNEAKHTVIINTFALKQKTARVIMRCAHFLDPDRARPILGVQIATGTI